MEYYYVSSTRLGNDFKFDSTRMWSKGILVQCWQENKLVRPLGSNQQSHPENTPSRNVCVCLFVCIPKHTYKSIHSGIIQPNIGINSRIDKSITE